MTEPEFVDLTAEEPVTTIVISNEVKVQKIHPHGKIRLHSDKEDIAIVVASGLVAVVGYIARGPSLFPDQTDVDSALEKVDEFVKLYKDNERALDLRESWGCRCIIAVIDGDENTTYPMPAILNRLRANNIKCIYEVAKRLRLNDPMAIVVETNAADSPPKGWYPHIWVHSEDFAEKSASQQKNIMQKSDGSVRGILYSEDEEMNRFSIQDPVLMAFELATQDLLDSGRSGN